MARGGAIVRRYLFLCANCHSAHALTKTDVFRYCYGANLVPECCGQPVVLTGWNARVEYASDDRHPQP